MPYNKKRKADRPPRELIPEDSKTAAGAAVLDGKPVNAVARESGVTLIRAILQEIRATSDTICRPVYTTTQIFTDLEEERILSDYLLRATKLHYSLFWK